MIFQNMQVLGSKEQQILLSVFDYTQSKTIKKNISWIGSVTTQARKKLRTSAEEERTCAINCTDNLHISINTRTHLPSWVMIRQAHFKMALYAIPVFIL